MKSDDYHEPQGDTLITSRPFETIDKISGWIDSRLGLSGKRICDLGCLC